MLRTGEYEPVAPVELLSGSEVRLLKGLNRSSMVTEAERGLSV